MSIATQVKRLQDVRNQIRAKMVALGLSKNTDLLQKLANDLDGVDKVSPTKESTDPGTSYTNVDTLSRNTDTRYIKIPKGYNDANRKFTVDGVANGSYSASVSSHDIAKATASSSVTGSITSISSTTKPAGTDNTDYYTITPSLTTSNGSSTAVGTATIDVAGYLAAGYTPSPESFKTVEVDPSPGDSYYLKASSVTKEDPGTGYINKATVTPAKTSQHVKITAGYLPNSKITVEAIPSPYFDTSGVTATAGTVLKNYTFVDSNGKTVTGTIATATSKSVSGSVEGSDPDEIVLSTETFAKTITVPVTAKATVAKNLYTGSSDIVADLKSNTFFVTARATLVSTAPITSTDQVPSPLPAGTAQISPGTDNVARLYTASNNGFMTGVYLSPMPSGSVYGPYLTKPDESYPNKVTITPIKSPQYAKITAGHLPNSKITVEGIPKQEFTIAQSAWSATSSATENGSYTCTVSGLTDVTAGNDVVVLPGNTSVVDSCGVYASSQGAESITFKAFNKPSSDIKYTVYILK